jgi:hypothetical protein
MENPPPNAPFMKQIRNTPAKAIRIVAAVRCGPIVVEEAIITFSLDRKER